MTATSRPSMERRVLLAISLSVPGAVRSTRRCSSPPPRQDAGNATPARRPRRRRPAAIAAAETATAAADRRAVPPARLSSATPKSARSSSKPRSVRAVFTNRGGRLRHWILKEYRNDAGRSRSTWFPRVIPRRPAAAVLAARRRCRGDARAERHVYRVRCRRRRDGHAADDDHLRARNGRRAAGRARSSRSSPTTFVVTFTAQRAAGQCKPSNPIVEWGPGLGDDIARTQPGSFLSPNYIYHAQAIYHHGRRRRRAKRRPRWAPDVVREGQFRWAGVDDHYFISAVLQPPAPVRVEYQPVTIPSLTTPPVVGPLRRVRRSSFPRHPKACGSTSGPKQLDVMRSIDPEFTRAIYFGMFAWLAAPLLDALRWVHGYVGNWGWSIIVLTILINLAMFPLRHKSVVSMRRMQELQPQMKAIQDRYAKYKITDPERQKMNTEVMELYKSQGRQPGERLCADAADPAVPLCVLRDARPGDRDPRRGLLVDSRPVASSIPTTSRRR